MDLLSILAKLSGCKERSTDNWIQFLSLALWADRISVRRTTGYSAFEMVYGRECLLPIQLSIGSWNVVDWDTVKSHEDLILARMRQMDQQTLARDQAAENLMNSRKSNKATFDNDRRLRTEQLKIGDLVLLFKSKDEHSRTRANKLDDKWTGPYRIFSIPNDSTYYHLEELDGSQLAGTFAGNRLRRFFTREELLDDRIQRDEALKAMDERIATGQRQFATQHADRLRELEEMAEMAKRGTRDGNATRT
jgi:hypothetical protein